jgi:uncharacterized protein
MPVDHIRYDILAQEALRGVVRTVLTDAAKNGLPGEHHFFITFDTGAEGVQVSPRMRAQYPAAMTIVLQHQFWDLVVDEAGFSVGLSFGGIAEKLAVPFAAIKEFVDPSVPFGMKFEEVHEQPAADDAPEASAAKDRGGKRPRRSAEANRDRAAPTIAAVPAPANLPPTVAASPDDGPDKPAGGGEVVRLDRFRKK